MLRADLGVLCAGRAGNEFVFASKRHKTLDAGPFDRKWLNRVVHAICKLAGTRDVCAHGLRDTYTSVMVALARKSDADVAKLVGHSDDGQTARNHYIGVPKHYEGLEDKLLKLQEHRQDAGQPPDGATTPGT